MSSSMHLILFDDSFRESLQPLASTRPVSEFRVGVLTVREKWEKFLQASSSWCTADYLSELFPLTFPAGKNYLWINGRVLPNADLVKEITALGEGEALVKGESVIAYNAGTSTVRFVPETKDHLSADISIRVSAVASTVIQRIHDIFRHNGAEILHDITLMQCKNESKLSDSNRVIGHHPVILGKGVVVEACIFNTTKGPVYVGNGAEIMEGSMIRGPVCIGDGAQIKMGAKIYGDTTIGPGCKVGGEVTNCVLFGNTNKAHDGFIGNSVIGEWCNLGADTNTSNLKNNYATVQVYNYALGGSEDTGLQFHGLIMGDHSKCGINTMFNTGTVVGVSANIYGGNFPEKFLPDFSWGGADGVTEFRLDKAMEVIERVYERRNRKVSPEERKMLQELFRQTAHLRQ